VPSSPTQETVREGQCKQLIFWENRNGFVGLCCARHVPRASPELGLELQKPPAAYWTWPLLRISHLPSSVVPVRHGSDLGPAHAPRLCKELPLPQMDHSVEVVDDRMRTRPISHGRHWSEHGALHPRPNDAVRHLQFDRNSVGHRKHGPGDLDPLRQGR
jgi:hypothetical protein